MATSFWGEGNIGSMPDFKEFPNGNEEPRRLLRLNVYFDLRFSCLSLFFTCYLFFGQIIIESQSRASHKNAILRPPKSAGAQILSNVKPNNLKLLAAFNNNSTSL